MQTRVAVVDADGHVMETDAELYEYLPPPYRGNPLIMVQSQFFPTIDGWNRAARRIADGQNRVPESPNAQDWLAFLDEAGVASTVLYPTAGLTYGLIKDPHWATALGQAYNDWLYDRYVRISPRLKGAALIPLQDVDAAVRELRRAVTELGMVAAMLPAIGPRFPLGNRSFWPIYQAAEELGCVLTVHAGATQGVSPLELLERLIEVRTLSHSMGQSVQMTSMIFSGIFDAFPRLRIAYAEAGCGWVPYLAERMDMEFEHRRNQAPDLKVRPSEHLASGRIFVHCELDERGLPAAIEVLGEDSLFAASDYPHEPKREFPENVARFLERGDLTDTQKTKILADNPRRMYGFQ
jgi:predicted TIM-barrel fold metal-dependent hydrolase